MPKNADVRPVDPRKFYVLLALAGEDRHGYALAKAIETLTDGAVRLAPASLYPVIHQLLVDGWITELGEDPEDPRRRRYRLSPMGKRIAKAEADRLDALIRVARALMPVTHRT